MIRQGDAQEARWLTVPLVFLEASTCWPSSFFPSYWYATTDPAARPFLRRSEEHTSALQSLLRISYAVFCLTKTLLTPHRPSHPHLPSLLPTPPPCTQPLCTIATH